MLNINWGHNRELMEKCRKLSEYAQFVNQIRQYLAGGLDRESAVFAAVESCIKSDILKDLLIQHKAEVMDMLLTEYNEELDRKELFELGREEGLLEGREKGLSEGREKGLSEGRAEGLSEGILEILTSLGEVPEELQQRIVSQSNPDVLKSWLHRAAAVSSISEFIQSLD